MRGGVEILFEPGTRVPIWVRNQTRNVRVGKRQLYGRTVRSLRIRGGEALFFPGGRVDVKMPGSDEFWGAFAPLKVHEICDFKGNLVERNHFLCTKCGTLSGKITADKPSEVFGRIDASFTCTQCKYTWEKRI